jgi:phosphopantetheine adenylyltransferase
VYYIDDAIIYLYSSSVIVQSPKGKLKKLNVERTGINNYYSGAKNNNYFYFVGYDKEYGRQFYRYDLSDLTSTTVEKIDFEKIVVSPNPSNYSIEINGLLDTNNELHYSIKNLSGVTIEKGDISSKTLRVNHIQSGLYLLELYKKSDLIAVKKIIIAH